MDTVAAVHRKALFTAYNFDGQLAFSLGSFRFSSVRSVTDLLRGNRFSRLATCCGSRGNANNVIARFRVSLR
jgi:hypothetical protein